MIKYSTYFMFYDIKQVIQATNPSDVNEVELNQNETVAHKTENLLVASDEKPAELENTTGELTEQKEISIEPNNVRELQIDEIIAEQDQPSQESDANPTEPEQAAVEVSAIEYSEFNATVSASVQEIDEVSVAEDKCVILEEEDVALEMPKQKVEEIEAAVEKHIEEEVNFYLFNFKRTKKK
jgi:hypothetical protein